MGLRGFGLNDQLDCGLAATGAASTLERDINAPGPAVAEATARCTGCVLRAKCFSACVAPRDTSLRRHILRALTLVRSTLEFIAFVRKGYNSVRSARASDQKLLLCCAARECGDY